MGDSIVDLGAAAADYVGEALSGAYDYMTGAPEASASGGYYKSLGPGARQYFPGPGEDKSSSIMDYIGFDDGGEVPLQDDGSLPGVDALRYMTPEEVDTGSYAFLQDMEQKMMDHLSAAQSPVTTESGVPMQAAPDNRRYHYEEAERLRGLIDQFRERRASAILNYPDSETKLYMKEGQDPYVRGFPDSLVQDFGNGGVVSLGAADPEYIDMGDMSLNDAMGLTRDNPAYMQESGFSGPAYAEDQTRPADLTGPFFEEYAPVDGEYKRLDYYDMYQDFPAGRSGRDFGPSAPEIAMQDGGEVPIKEAGIGSFLYDAVTGNVPSDQYNSMRTSGRMDDPMAQAIYGEDPTFMETLVKQYGYPATIPMQDDQGFAVMDSETGGQKKMIATDFNLPEYMRTGRPRKDMPTYGELEDARAHALASALMAKDYGPETAKTAGGIKEFSEMLPGFGSSKYKDTKMDLRNNALGVKLLKEAGVNATPAQLARTVDREVFSQLDRILDRPKDRQDTPAKDQPFADHYFKSPEGGLDVYFPRDKEGYFDTSYIYD
jgi:hypothetical protein